MGKWTTVFTNATKDTRTDAQKRAANKAVNKMLRNTASKSVADMKKESDALYEAQVAREDSLLAAYEEKKLKSATLIKEAKGIVAARKEKASPKKQTKAKA